MAPALPPRFLERLAAMAGQQTAQRVAAAMALPRRVGFRVNPLLAAEEEVLAELRRDGLAVQPVAPVPGGWTVAADQRAQLSHSTAVTAGRAYIQNPASMIPPLLLDVHPHHHVLDLCAAPGSKTLQLAAMIGKEGEGRLAAVEAVRHRFFRLRANLARHGAGWVHTYLRDGATVWRATGPRFHRVLVDAPCSSEGQFHLDHPKSFAYWSEKKIQELARKQQRLLAGGIGCLHPGGLLLYATCTLAPEENEMVVAAVLRRFGDQVAVLPPPAWAPGEPGLCRWRDRRLPEAVRHCRRILPDEVFEGFFYCLLRRAGGDDENPGMARGDEQGT